jgi:hypothetical protein
VCPSSVVPVPDGTETQEMCPREFPLFPVFPVFQRFPQYYVFRNNVYGFRNMFTVSVVCLRFPKYVYGFRNMFTVSDICVTNPGVGSLRGDPRRLRGGPRTPGANCHALVTALGVLRRKYGAMGVSRGGYPVRGSRKGGNRRCLFQ